jgi:copper(I)-binding protein
MYICNRRIMSRGAAALFALAVAQTLASGLKAAEYSVGSIQISQPWARATPKGATSGAAYMTLMNSGTTPQRLSCVSSDAAAKCQIHEMTMTDGVMKMRPVEGGLEIKPGETVTLKPGGFHMMLVDLKQPLEQGKTIEATLKVENGGTVEVQFPIAAIGAPAPGAAAGGEMKMQGPPGGMMQMKH